MVAAAGKISLRISEDKMSAELAVAPGTALSFDDVRQELAAQGIVFGIDLFMIERVLAEPGEWLKIAQGQSSVATVHGSIQQHFQTPGKKSPEEGEGKADFKNLGLIVNVKAGDKLATLIDAIPGIPGRTIVGRETGVEEARRATLRAGKNTELDAEGRNLFCSVNGRIVIDTKGTISVEPDLKVHGDVGPATGNIDFIGPITINGNVCSDYQVKSADTITINGAVEGASVFAVNSVKVLGGVFGAEKAVIQSRGDIEVRHAQDAALLCGGTIRVNESLLRVKAVAAHEIIIEEGTIIGGTTTAPRISAKTLGNEAGTKTIVEIGIEPRTKLTADRLEREFRTHRAALLKKRVRLDPLVALINGGKILQRDDKAQLDILEAECAELEKQILEVGAELKLLLQNPAACVSGELAVSGALYPGTVIASVHSDYSIGMPRSELTIAITDGKIVL